MKSGNVTDYQTKANIRNSDKELQEFEGWIKYMNYKLFLEHAHSTEYYIQRQKYMKQEGENLS